jgi:uncharacterized repeat protein (TIGR01451 family)
MHDIGSGGRRTSLQTFLAAVTGVLLLLCAAAARADTVFAVSDSAGVYLIETSTGAVMQSYGILFSGTSTQNVAEDLSGNLYVTDSTGKLWKSTFNPNGPPFYAAAVQVGGAITSGANTLGSVARLGFDTSGPCAGGCLVTFFNSTTIWWIDPATATVKKTLTTSAAVAGGGDLTVQQTAAGAATIYVVSGTNFYSINATSGTVTGPTAVAGPTGSLTGLAQIGNGRLVACEQIGSGSPWTLYELTTAGAVVATHTGITTGSDVVNDMASVPALFTATKTGTAAGGPGDSVVYKVTVTNTGFVTYPTAMLKDPVPSNITISATTPPSCAVAGGGSCAITSSAGAQTVTAQVTNLAASATATLTITGTPTVTSGSQTNVGTVSVPYDPGGGGAMSSSPPGVTTTYTSPNLTKQVTNVTQSLGPANAEPANPGDTMEYTLQFTNRRGVAMTSLTIQDLLPPNTTYTAASATCVAKAGFTTCTPSMAAGTVQFAFAGGSLANNAVVTLKFRVTVN